MSVPSSSRFLGLWLPNGTYSSDVDPPEATLASATDPRHMMIEFSHFICRLDKVN